MKAMIIGKILFFFLPFLMYAETPFLLLTVPKSGTWLAVNLFQNLCGKSGQLLYMPGTDFREVYPKTFEKGVFYFYHYRPWTHFPKQDHLFKGIPLFVNVRDPRDVSVSSAFFFKKELDAILGEEADFNERLRYVITTEIIHDGLHDFFGPAAFYKNLFRLMETYPSTLLYFEELIGPQGGGSKELQTAAIQNLSASLGIYLTELEASELGNRIYGGTLTFRDGKIGSWKSHFTEEHKTLFKQTYLNKALIQLGYEIDSNW